MSENNSNQKETPSASTGNRGKSWDQVEDRELCKSWLAASSDTGGDNGSPAGQFWHDITEHFNKKFEKTRKPNEKERSRNGLLCRWNHIHPRVNIFCGSLDEAKQLCTSESEDFDVLLKAKEIYTIAWKNEKETEEVFKLYHCFQELNGNPKWIRHMEFKNKNKDKNTNVLTDTTPPPTPLTSEQSESRSDDRIVPHEPELIETVIEEELLSDDEDILVHETLKRKSTFYDQYLELQEKKLKLLERSNDIAIMTVNPHSFSNPSQIKFFQLRQDEILRRFKEERGKEFNKAETNCHCNH